MISTKEMREAEGKNVRITYTDGEVTEKFCTCYQSPQVDDEEPFLEFGRWVINQSEIEKLEILDE